MIERLTIQQAETTDDYFYLFHKYTTDKNYTLLDYNGYYKCAVFKWAEDTDNIFYVFIFYNTLLTDYQEDLKDMLAEEPNKEIIDKAFSKLTKIKGYANYTDNYNCKEVSCRC